MKVKISKTFEIDHVFSHILDCSPFIFNYVFLQQFKMLSLEIR
jgi:hypothetical protein